MTGNIGAIQPTGLFQYSPTFMQNYADIDEIDMMSNPYSMNGSIFGLNGVNPMGGMGYDPNKSYFDNMKDMQKQWNEYYVDQQKLNRQNDVQVNAPMEAIRETATNLKDKILHDEQDQIENAYIKYYNSVRSAYGGEGTDEELNSRALSLYTQLNGGRSLVQDLREHGHSSFLQGFIQTLSLGMYGKKSAEDNIAEITKQEVPMGEKIEQNAGRIAGITTVGAGAYGITKALSGNTGAILKTLGKFATSKAGIFSLIAAGAVAVTTLFTSKISA